MTRRVLITGNRDWQGSWESIAEHFPADDAHAIIIHGGCSRFDDRGVQRSVDMIADFVARGLGLDVEAYPVDHAIDGPWPEAGPNRNGRMLRFSRPTEAIAFGKLWKPVLSQRWLALGKGAQTSWKRRGAGDMARKLLRAKVTTRWVHAPDVEAVELLRMPPPGCNEPCREHVWDNFAEPPNGCVICGAKKG